MSPKSIVLRSFETLRWGVDSPVPYKWSLTQPVVGAAHLLSVYGDVDKGADNTEHAWTSCTGR